MVTETIPPQIGIQRFDPCYCSLCNDAHAIKVTLRNPLVVQPMTFALCIPCARLLRSSLTVWTSKRGSRR